jgi:hypothetical protein
MDYLTTHTSLSPIRRWFAPGFVIDNQMCTRLAAASDQVHQFHCPWSVVLSGYSGFWIFFTGQLFFLFLKLFELFGFLLTDEVYSKK